MKGDMQCPHCEETANFSITTTVVLSLTHSEDRGEEIDRPTWDAGEDEGEHVCCDSCGQEYTVRQFKEAAAASRAVV